MGNRDYLIAGIREQRTRLNQLVRKLERRTFLDSRHCKLYERLTKEVEKNLRELRKIALDEILKEIQTSANQEENE